MKTAAVIVTLAALLAPFAIRGADDRVIWESFSRAFRERRITAERLRPYSEQLREPLLGIIDSICRHAKPEDWEQGPPAVSSRGLQPAQPRKLPGACVELLGLELSGRLHHSQLRTDRLRSDARPAPHPARPKAEILIAS